MKNNFRMIALWAYLGGRIFADQTTYYIDYESGSDTNSGTSIDASWMHCPGDPDAAGVPASVELSAGDTLLFKGGVSYRGRIECKWSGANENPIVYDGNTVGTFGSGQAIIDGSEPLDGEWTYYAPGVYWTDVSAYGNVTPCNANLTQGDAALWVAQDPNQPDPFWYAEEDHFADYPVDTATSNSFSSSYLDMDDADYWDGSTYVLLWVNSNRVNIYPVTGFNSDTDTLSFEYWAQDLPYYHYGKFAMFNSLQVMDQVGEYVVREDEQRIYLRSTGDAPTNIHLSVRGKLFEIDQQSHIIIQGFTIQKAMANITTYDETAIDGTGTQQISVLSNHVTRCKSMLRYAGIGFDSSVDLTIEGNTIDYNSGCRGIKLGQIDGGSIRRNVLTKNGGTGISALGLEDSVLEGNTITEHYGNHANGMSVYRGVTLIPQSTNVIVRNNYISDGYIAFTLKDAVEVDVRNNVFICGDSLNNAVNLYARCEQINLFNNLILNTESTKGKGLSVTTVENYKITAKNNIMDGSSMLYAALSYTEDPQFVSENNCYTMVQYCQSTNKYGAEVWGAGEFTAERNDLFVDEAYGDYSLKSGCAAIDAGVDVGLSYAGLAPDCGAFEWCHGSCSVHYSEWSTRHNLTKSYNEDEDGDGWSNFYEYALNGNPTNAQDKGFFSCITQGDEIQIIHASRNDETVDYILESTTNLVSGRWSTNQLTTLPETGTLDDEYITVTNQLNTESGNAQFIRIRCE